MDFTQVVMAHIGWKQRLDKYLNGDRSENLKPDVICQDNQCVLGKWIYGEGVAYQHYAEFPHVKEEHATFHKLAAEVVRKCDAGNVVEARQLLEADYSRVSERVKRWIVRLARNIDGKKRAAG